MSFGTTNFDHYRTRALLYAGKPAWTLLDDLAPRQNAKSRQTRQRHDQAIRLGEDIERVEAGTIAG